MIPVSLPLECQLGQCKVWPLPWPLVLLHTLLHLGFDPEHLVLRPHSHFPLPDLLGRAGWVNKGGITRYFTPGGHLKAKP